MISAFGIEHGVAIVKAERYDPKKHKVLKPGYHLMVEDHGANKGARRTKTVLADNELRNYNLNRAVSTYEQKIQRKVTKPEFEMLRREQIKGIWRPNHHTSRNSSSTGIDRENVNGINDTSSNYDTKRFWTDKERIDRDQKLRAALKTRRKKIVKSFLSVNGPDMGTSKPITSMSTNERANLRSSLIRQTDARKQKKIFTGPLKRPFDASKRPNEVSEQFKNRSRVKRTEARELHLSQKPAEAVEVLQRAKFAPSKSQMLKIGLSSAIASGAARELKRRHSVSKAMNKNRRVDAGIGAAGGASAMVAANEVGGWAAKRSIESYRHKNWDNKVHNPIWSEHRKKYGVEQAKSGKVPLEFFEKYPKALPGSKATRILAIKNRPSVATASITSAAALGAALASRRKTK